MIDRKAFFAGVRKPLFGSLSAGQVAGMEAILDEWDQRGFTDLRWLAYMLATAFHETARKMQPIHEYGGKAYFDRRYGPGTPVGKVLGNTVPGDGSRFHGRGYVQLTGRRNYAFASRELGVDFLADPDRAIELGLAASIMFLGMIEGWFTGKKLSDYINSSKTDFFNARRVVNVTDKAATIKGYANIFWDALKGAYREDPAPVPLPSPPAPVPTPPPPDDPGPTTVPHTPAPMGFWAWLRAWWRGEL